MWIKTVYDMTPKWLLMILVVALLASSGWLWVKVSYLGVKNATLTNDNKILTENVRILQSKLDICTTGLAAIAESYKQAEAINEKIKNTKCKISKICVKEEVGDATDKESAIDISNNLSDTVNRLRQGQNH